MLFSLLFSSLANSERIGSFIVLGDWGYDKYVHCSPSSGCGMNPGCQQAIADKMKSWVAQNPDVKFVISVGDNFYPSGVSSPKDPQWTDKWKNVYGDTLTNLRWYSVYGNHDYEGHDRCACTDPAKDPSACAQRTTGNSELNGWYMPELYYADTTHVDDLGIEIVALDTNSVAESACKYLPSGCSRSTCWANMNARYKVSMDLFAKRMKETKASSVIVFNHYPPNYFHGSRSSFIDALKTGPANGGELNFFAGHVHFVQQSWEGQGIAPQTNWLVGGGGGWGCDGSSQGFVVGIINREGGKTTIQTHAELVDHSTCCYHHVSADLQTSSSNHTTTTPTKKKAGVAENWFSENDNQIYRTEEWIKDQLETNFDQTCGGLECKERRDMLVSWRQKERLQHFDGEAKTMLDDEQDRESYADYSFSDYFHETIASVKRHVEAQKARRTGEKTDPKLFKTGN